MALEKAPKQQKIIITPATPTDAQAASRLIYLAMGRFADYIFGLGDPARAITILEKLFTHNGNRFSYQHTISARTVNGDTVGIVIAYPCNKTMGLYLMMARQLLPIYGVLDSLLFLWNTLLYSLSIFPPRQSKECLPDEYYISTLAVLPEYQSMGIGTMLLGYAEDEAKRNGFKKCALGVSIDNDRALRLYKHLGYKVVETTKVKYLNHRIGANGFYRMVKDLG